MGNLNSKWASIPKQNQSHRYKQVFARGECSKEMKELGEGDEDVQNSSYKTHESQVHIYSVGNIVKKSVVSLVADDN